MIPITGVNKIRIDEEEKIRQHTLDVLDTELVDETRREDTRCKSTTEDIAEFCVETTNTHVLEFEVGRDDSIRGSSTSVISRRDLE